MLAPLIAELEAIRADMLRSEKQPAVDLSRLHPDFRASARNLLHYLALRRRDLRPLQARLAQLGLSSLGRSESHVMATIDTVLATLGHLAQVNRGEPAASQHRIDFAAGTDLLQSHTRRLLGNLPEGRDAHIMVTMPTAAAEDFQLVHDLVLNGMTCMRINCAHDSPTVWSGMIANLRRAEKLLNRRCRVSMDLAGPKLRTGPVAPGPAVIKVRPLRDDWGKVVRCARLWLADEQNHRDPPSPADACLPVSALWLAQLGSGDRVEVIDTRGARRVLTVADVTSRGCWLESAKTVYFGAGTVIRLLRKGVEHSTAVVSVPGKDRGILLRSGDLLILSAHMAPGTPATQYSSGELLTPARVSCTLPEVIGHVRSGEEVWFDDGKIGGRVERTSDGELHVRVTSAPEKGARLRGDKGINFPASDLQLPAMTAKDRRDIEFVAANADIVALSFANNVEDVRSLIDALHEHDRTDTGAVLKIETVSGFRNLPAMLLEAMRLPSCGVMIARGDLAVESGFGRLAEVQEEILWLSEAAHVPVIWATQVLENVAKHGAPTRAEITDAAMGHRAECVMLNKGPYIVRAVKILDDILKRMQGHQLKKQSMLRELSLAGAYAPLLPGEPGPLTP